MDKNELVIIDPNDDILVISTSLVGLLLKQNRSSDLIALYFFYYYTAKWQKTNQPKATSVYCLKALDFGYDRFTKAQKKLIELGLIEKYSRRDINGKIIGWYIKVNFIWRHDTINDSIIKDIPISIEVKDSPGYMYKEFQHLKLDGLSEKILKRDKYKCIYCGNPLTTIKSMHEKGKTIEEIARFVRQNKTKIATIDHIIPISKGGNNDDSNLVSCCMSCNSTKYNHIPNFQDQGITTYGKTGTNALSANKENALSAVKEKRLIVPLRNEEYLPLAKKLSEIVCTNKRVSHTARQIKSWSNEIRRLVEENKIEKRRIDDALDWYANNIGGQYIPVIESGKSLREKFTKLEAAIQRDKFSYSKAEIIEKQNDRKLPRWLKQLHTND